MSFSAKLLNDVFALLQKGDLLAAEEMLAPDWNASADPPAPARHALGLIRRAQGRLADAEGLFRQAVEKEPHQPEFHNSLGLTLRAGGFPTEAEKSFRAALICAPDYWQAAYNLVRVLLDQDRAKEAASIAHALALSHSHLPQIWAALATARQRLQDWKGCAEAGARAVKLAPNLLEGQAMVALSQAKLGDWDGANQRFASITQGAGAQQAEASLGWARALAEAGRFEEAKARFEAALTAAPHAVSAHDGYAQFKWMRGDQAGFLSHAQSALAAAPDHIVLRLKIADLLNRADRPREALQLLQAAPIAGLGLPEVKSALAVLSWQTGDGATAVRLAEEAVQLSPETPDARKTALSAQVIAGDPQKAITHARWGRGRYPADQEWIALEATALRRAGDSAYRRLYDYDRFVAAYDLAAPAGFDSVAAFNAALAARLREMHVYAAHPLDQSLRGGTQTPVSLLDSDDPLIKAFLAALDAPIRAHIARIGADRDHPLTSRSTGDYAFAGCWSVRLTQGGSHVNHVHPQGWLSSAYYVSVPADVEDAAAQTGWLTFGEPRFTQANLPPEHTIKPQVGRLALFPSYLWHGVRPFTAGAERMTIAFDVVPK
jgi:uncharacterized protein (TIGR02466 family)